MITNKQDTLCLIMWQSGLTVPMAKHYNLFLPFMQIGEELFHILLVISRKIFHMTDTVDTVLCMYAYNNVFFLS